MFWTQCTRCGEHSDETAARCRCGFPFEVKPHDLDPWFAEVRQILETAYLRTSTPWQQSGKGGTFEDWTRGRLPVSDCVDRSGTFLDIGCANGFLLECLVQWGAHKGLRVEPHGLDLSHRLIDLARSRLPSHAHNLSVGNAWDWVPPRRYDYVRTEVLYVPRNLRRQYLARLQNDFLAPEGRLLVAHYGAMIEDPRTDWIDAYLRELGFRVEGYACGFRFNGVENDRVAVVKA